jgi:hypothetical protein
MTTRRRLDALARAQGAIINEVRSSVAAGAVPDAAELERRLRAAAAEARTGADPAQTEAIDRSERSAKAQLEQVLGVHRARQRLAAAPAPPPPAPAPPRPSLRAALRTRPTITGNMELKRVESGEGRALGWEAVAGIASWEVRFSERPRPGSDYELLETLTLPAEATEVELPLGDKPFRVNLLGRTRDGRPRSRALVSGLTRESWNTRWERRATSS